MNAEEASKAQKSIISNILDQRKKFFDLCEFGPFGIEYSPDMRMELDNDFLGGDKPPEITLRQCLLRICGVERIQEMANLGEEKVIRLFVLKDKKRESPEAVQEAARRGFYGGNKK